MSDSRFEAEGKLLAAIDLGSNSFHMVVARVEHGEVRPVEKLADNVQLAAGFSDGFLDQDAIARGLECLARFRQALDTLNPDEVRIIGTNSLRMARNARQFRHGAEAILGHPLEIISGREEARLVYLGVAHSLADDSSRLVVDIGGGSTEFIIGERFETRLLESLHMGCVSYGERFFGNGRITAKAFEQAYFSAYSEVLNIRRDFKRAGWKDAVGSSGTLKAVESVIVANGWAEAGINAVNLQRLRKLVLKHETVDDLAGIAGLSERRRSVFASGLAITLAFFDALDISDMRTSSGALREGIIYDTIGRLSHEDVRERSVNALMQRYAVDEQNAARVEETARYLFEGVRGSWSLGDEDLEHLVWSCRLHEIGLAISHSGFHKHGQYLVENSDLPGFSKTEQLELALLVRAHRQKFPADLIRERINGGSERLVHLCLILRLAVLFKYVTQVEETPPYQLDARGADLRVSFPCGWLQNHPLTRFALSREQELLGRKGISLSVETGM